MERFTVEELRVSLTFLIKLKNETKNITIERYNVLDGVNKTMQSSKGVKKFIRPVECVIKVEGMIFENVINVLLKCDNIPML